MKKFEYFVKEMDIKGFFSRKVDVPEITQELNELGEEGWELVDKTAIGDLGTPTKFVFVFKRELV
jgi:hypothetical protein